MSSPTVSGTAYAVVDVETTGLNPSTDRVVQVAVGLMDEHGSLSASWSSDVNPHRHPGPVELHGITPERAARAPDFVDVMGHVTELLAGRVFVAHNAQFDWNFLAHEFVRAGGVLRTEHRLCTVQLASQLDLATPDLRLPTIAAHLGIRQSRHHDALDDVRTTAQVLSLLLDMASGYGLPLPVNRPPLVTAVAPATTNWGTSPPVPGCPHHWPGLLRSGCQLQQGMSFTITGGTTIHRDELFERGRLAGLRPLGSVSRRTSFLVANEHSRTRKYELCERYGILIVDEQTFLTMLGDVLPAEPSPTHPKGSKPSARRAVSAPTPSQSLLAGRRVLVLGGSHEERADIHARFQEMGGTVAVLLTASVTDVVVLEHGKNDSRYPHTVGLRQLDPGNLGGPDQVEASSVSPQMPLAMARGQVIDIETSELALHVSWDADTQVGEIDVIAMVLDEDRVVEDHDVCFFNQPNHPDGLVTLSLGSRGFATIDLDLSTLGTSRVMVAACIDGDGAFGDLGSVELTLRDRFGASLAKATLDAADQEASLLLASAYLRDGTPRFRVIGQGYRDRLPELLTRYGANVNQN